MASSFRVIIAVICVFLCVTVIYVDSFEKTDCYYNERFYKDREEFPRYSTFCRLYRCENRRVILVTTDQTNGDLSSQMFAYLHHKQFSTYLRNNSGISKLVIWIDGCGYQNKSADIANSELNVGVETNAPVEQKFLSPNHTQLDCSAMHSLIERE
ncbi:hypothetical protein PoB_002708900 [Plakobranchus ocellatus]|uniref:Uncharacterized protein n=1 Tax=Plakobranchus ocellatus TaxID=259542 RepID=A0AAV4A313_9GAST|nr:hypothetical protein PoB_002708900 [Plakobranchus ocellatus]